MKLDLRTWGPLTVLLIVGVTIVLLVGAILVVTGEYNGQFKAWVNDLVVLLGLLGVGKGIQQGLAKR